MSYELLLCGLAGFLYLYDCIVLLYANEAILSCDTKSVWRATVGIPGLIVAGRRVCFLNPLTPHRPCVKLRWDMHVSEPLAEDPSWSADVLRLRALAPGAWTAAVAIILLVPLGLFTPLGLPALITGIVVLYGSIAIDALLLQRCPFPALSPLRHLLFSVECLACPPFGVNVVRRTSLMHEVRESLLSAGQRLLPRAEWKRLLAYCVASVEQELAELDGPSVERESLEGHLTLLRALTTAS